MSAIPRPFTIISSSRPAGGTVYGLNGQTFVGDVSGAWGITANGTNQNITLTPSGTGQNRLAGNTLLGGLATNGTGVLQFPVATTSAGGIALGDMFLYRVSATVGAFETAGAATWRLIATGASSNSALDLNCGASGTGIISVRGTAALTFSAALHATFAGFIKPASFTTAGAPAYAPGQIYYDTTLNKLRVGGATAYETITSV